MIKLRKRTAAVLENIIERMKRKYSSSTQSTALSHAEHVDFIYRGAEAAMNVLNIYITCFWSYVLGKCHTLNYTDQSFAKCMEGKN